MRAKLDSPRMASGRQIAACMIVVLAALSIAACGGDSPQGPKIPPDTANLLSQKLDVVQSRLTPEKECGTTDTAQTSLDGVQAFVDQIPEADVDPQIISDLRQLLDTYQQKLSADCAAGGLATAQTTTTTTETTPTETTGDTKVTTDRSTTTTDSTDETTTSSTQSTTSTDTNPPETSPPSHSNAGGNGNGNGGSSQGGFEAGGTAPGGRVPASGGTR